MKTFNHYITIFIIPVLVITVSGCEQQNRQSAINTAVEFIQSLKESNSDTLKRLSPWIKDVEADKMSELSAVMEGLSSYKVKSVQTIDTIYYVTIELVYDETTKTLTIPVLNENDIWTVQENISVSVHIDFFPLH